MKLHYCPVCGKKLGLRQHPTDGPVAWCEACGDWRYPLFSTAVSVTILNPERSELLLIRQYGEPGLVFVAGYVDKGEAAEDAVRREVREELGMKAENLRFHKSRFYAPSETLMLHYSCTVPEAMAQPNAEVDAWEWVPVEDVRTRLAPGLPTELYDDYLST